MMCNEFLFLDILKNFSDTLYAIVVQLVATVFKHSPENGILFLLGFLNV